MYQKIYQMVQGEIHSSDSDVASEFYFLMLRYISDVALEFLFFCPHKPPPLYIDLGEGHNNTLFSVFIYRIHIPSIPSRYSNIESLKLDDVTSEPWVNTE